MVKKKFSIAGTIVVIAAAAVFVAGALWWFGPGLLVSFQARSAQYDERYYAVYLDSGQALYAQVRGLTRDTLKLTNVYYLQSVTVGDKTTNNLVRRGTQEVSMPLNFLMVNRAHVLYWEAVGDSAPVIKAMRGGP